MFVKLDEYGDPIKGQINIIDYFPLSQLYKKKTLTSANLALNEVELTDSRLQNPFKPQSNFKTSFLTIDTT